MTKQEFQCNNCGSIWQVEFDADIVTTILICCPLCRLKVEDLEKERKK